MDSGLDRARRARLWAAGSVLCFTGIGWGWTGDAPRVVSPTACFIGALVCAVGAVAAARRAAPEERLSARAAAGVAVGLLVIPVLLFGALILFLLTRDSSFFE